MLIRDIDNPEMFLRTYCTPYTPACDTLIERQPVSTSEDAYSLQLVIDPNATRFGAILYCDRATTAINASRFIHAKRSAPLAEMSISLIDMLDALASVGYVTLELIDPCVENETDLKTRMRIKLELDYHATSSNSSNTTQQLLKELLVDMRKRLNGDSDQLPAQFVWNRINDIYLDRLQHHLRADDVQCQSSHVAYWCSLLGRLPAPLFARWMPAEMPDEAYWRYLIDIAIHCFGAHGLDTPDQMNADLQLQLATPDQLLASTPHALRLVVHASCMFANACDYAPDMVRQEESERFIDVNTTLAGDCEDTAKHVQVLLTQLQKNWRSLNDSLLQTIGHVLEYYYIMLATVAVTSAAANTMRDPSTAANNVEELMCHTVTLMVPRHYVHKTLMVPPLVSKFRLQNNNTAPMAFESELPVLVCEGTYVVDPLLHDPMFYEIDTTIVDTVANNRAKFRRRRIDVEKALPALQSMLLRAESNRTANQHAATPERFCSFYRRVNELWIDLGTDFGVVPMAVTYNGSRYGVWMQDLVEKRATVRGLIVYEYSASDVAAIQQALMHAPPMRSLTFIKSRSAAMLSDTIKRQYSSVSSQLDSLCTLYAYKPQPMPLPLSQPKQSNIAVRSVERWALRHYTYLVNHFEKITAGIVDGLKSFLQRIETQCAFRYNVYPMSNDGALYWIVFVIDVYDTKKE